MIHHYRQLELILFGVYDDVASYHIAM